jgi:uncharacterized protein (DUF3820 family)
MEFNDNTIMPFGIHKGKVLGEIPDKYMLDFYNKFNRGDLYGNFKHFYDYIESNLDAIKSNIKFNR